MSEFHRPTVECLATPHLSLALQDRVLSARVRGVLDAGRADAVSAAVAEGVLRSNALVMKLDLSDAFEAHGGEGVLLQIVETARMLYVEVVILGLALEEVFGVVSGDRLIYEAYCAPEISCITGSMRGHGDVSGMAPFPGHGM